MMPSGDSVVTKHMNWIHREQGAFLRMCHFDDVLDQSGIICTFLIVCYLVEGTF